ncbi:hypothetical protein ASE63_14765 [Bosea sp. Root381]|uniref:hypothetical protein n=1 Tax=Bosea sp. Root381 TaxID=1736524 RepID=UPI0006FCA828|nr:hypothetical protein [Bosea sp. Root381]KRE16966.1 hypothetical protein ASE63_14765 [Bosea sp. Root381]
MANMNSFPPDVAKRDEASEEFENAADTVRAKASQLADKASETVRDGYHRAKDALAETDPVELAREGGEAVRDAVVRHPLAAFGLGALSASLVAWACLRGSSSSGYDRYVPDYGRWGRLLQGYGNDAADTGESALRSGEKWLRSHSGTAQDYANQAREYADYGGRMLARRAEREPVAALLGLGLAVYVIGSMLSSSGGKEPAPARRRNSKS